MRVFDFTLLSGYEFSGVDVAQGFRARLFAKNNVNAKFIFTELPTIRDMELYGSQKIKRGQIMSAHIFMTGRLDMSLSVKKEALLENEKENYKCAVSCCYGCIYGCRLWKQERQQKI